MLRITAVLALAILLSGCTVLVTESETTSSTTRRCYVDGEEVPCDNGPSGPPEEHDIHDRLELTQGAQRTWSFSVHENATDAWLRVALVGAGGQETGAAADRGCVTLEGPQAQGSGNCSGANLAISVNPTLVAPGRPDVRLDISELAPGDHKLSIAMPPAAADLLVEIVVAY